MGTRSIRYVAARSQDAGRIAELSRDQVEAGLGWAWRRGRVLWAMGRWDHLTVVALAGAQLVGFGIMQYLGDRAHLVLLAVAADQQRRGIGRGLVTWLERCALNAGISTVSLEVRARNRGAQRFYRALGYRRERRLQGYYRGREAAVRMARRIGEADRADNAEEINRQLQALLDELDP